MFVGKARSLPLRGAFERSLTQVGSGITANIRLGCKGQPETNALAF